MNTLGIKPGRNYVDNVHLYNCFVEWYAQRAKAAEEGKPEPQPPRYISECIVQIPTRLSSKGNFAGYSFRDDMIGDAIENIIQYYRNFDPAKSQNPFAYLTQISYYAFLRRILKEKRQAYVKHKMLQNSDLLENISTQSHDDDGDYQVAFIETMKMNLRPELEEYFESKKTPKKIKTPGKSIEDLLEEEFEEMLKDE